MLFLKARPCWSKGPKLLGVCVSLYACADVQLLLYPGPGCRPGFYDNYKKNQFICC